jgi:adenylate cyclase
MGALGVGPEFEPDAATIRLCTLTRLAYEALVADDLPLALERYQAILVEYPDDPVAREMARRLAALESTRRAPLQMSR